MTNSELSKIFEEINNSTLRFGSNDDESAKNLARAEFGSRQQVTEKQRKFFMSQGIFLKVGTILTVPARKPLERTFETKMDTIEKAIDVAIKNIITGKTTLQDGLSLIGEVGASAIKEVISSDIQPPNSWITLKMAKMDTKKTLIGAGKGTGAMLRSISYEIKKQ